LVLKIDQIKHLHIELSSRCQAACPLCARNLYGFYERNDFKKQDLTLADIKRIFDTVDLDVTYVCFNGVFGDPCINTEFDLIVEYFMKRFPNLTAVEVSTNGGMHKPEWWANLGKKYKNKSIKLRIDFSIDGLEDTNHLYRIGVPYEKVIANARAFINAGGHANWKWIEFKHNQHQIDIAKNLSKQYGFKNFIIVDNERDHGYVKTKNSSYLIEPADYKNKKNKLNVPRNKTKDHVQFDKFMSIMTAMGLKELEKEWQENPVLECYHLTDKSVYINSLGELYPCCFLGQNPKTYLAGEANKQLKSILENYNNNLLEVDWQTAIKWFDIVDYGWKKSSVKEGMIEKCLLSCYKKINSRNFFKN